MQFPETHARAWKGSPATLDRVNAFDVRGASVAELLSVYRSVLDELKRRSIIRTLNAPTGDLAELLVANALEGSLAPNSEKSFDVSVSDGRLIQVKSRMIVSGKRGERQLSTIRSWDFSHLAVVLFASDYSISKAVLIPVEIAHDLASEDRHVRGNRLMATDSFFEIDGVEDITDLLAAALLGLDS